jgi:Galactose oxidase, central domain
MSKSYLFVIFLATLLVEGCGGGNSTPTPPPPSPVATHFSVTVPSAASAGVAIQVTVTALSASNNSVANYSGTVHFTSSDSRAILPTDATLISGTGSVFVTLNTAAAQTVTATDTATATITGTSSAISVSPAQFNPVGSMSTPREFHTATVLGDGKVLIAGGDEGTVSLATAELFDPMMGNFTPTGSLTTARQKSTATSLGDGKVLVTGGLGDNGQALTTAELFDPATGTFAPTGSMATKRALHTATMLKGGKVLVTGGIQSASNTQTTATAELFDPATGTFSVAGSMASPRGNHTATLLNNGMVLVAGGQGADGSVLTTAELFDPISGTFAATGSMGSARESFTATLLANGNVLVAGGDLALVAGGSLASAELFDPAHGVFTATGSMATARESHTATLRSDGTVLMVGGDHLVFMGGMLRPTVVPVSTLTTELYDPDTGTFTPASDMVEARARHTATLLGDGKVLVTGGRLSKIFYGNPHSTVLADAELLE